MSFITCLTRAWLTRTVKPFTFKNEYDEILPFAECENLGLYVHIPFCKSICNFCPYCKVRHSEELCQKYIDALIEEIPSGRFVGTDEISNLALYLAENSTSSLTGQIFGFNGGMYC